MKKITVVGAGALGSHVIMFLRNEDIKIKVIDFDHVESKNVQSQFHSKPSIGKPKTLGLQQTMNMIFGLKIDTVPHKLVENNKKELLSGSDLILDCLDNGEARKIVQSFAQENKIPCLHGALAPDGQFGRVIWSDMFKIDSEAGVGGATCENGDHLPFIVQVASLLARSAQVFCRTGMRINFQVTPTGSIQILGFLDITNILL